ncbi:alpha/beta fold hydrolase [Sulfitobacter sp.]|uniref:alpha/beta fold hydrolase n=1 Tax=Sulfitobacter sp. TaxID=1903071 RepID=UPI00300386CB
MSYAFKSTLSASLLALVIASPFMTPSSAMAAETVVRSDATQASFRSEIIDGQSIAYREAGDPSNPTVLLLHGFPTSSHMFRNLIPELAKDYHVIAPDYLGYGASDMPDAADYEYSFANTADMITQLLDLKNVGNYSVYLMDYGAPVGFRMFAEHPERVSGFIIQNGNAYEEGLKQFWDPLKAYWADPSAENGDPLRGFLGIDATKWQFTHGTQNSEAISPDNFWHVQYLLDRPGNQEVQLEMFLDYGTNVAEYPKWQALFREHQPPTLLMWGKNDHIFPADGAHPYKRDLENLEFHLLDTGHFALEEYGSEIASQMIEFLDENAKP